MADKKLKLIHAYHIPTLKLKLIPFDFTNNTAKMREA